MGRRTEFDPARAIERATKLFWARGYSRTGLRDLLEVMGIGEGSFYHAFGSKQDLYLACLKHYNATVYARRWAAFRSQPLVRDGVRHFFKAVLDDLDDPKIPNVCLMAGSLSADVLSAKELEKYVRAEMKTMELALVQQFDLAKQSAELPPSFQSAISAQVLVTFLQGFFRVARTLNSRAQLEAQLGALLKGLGL